MKYKLAIFDMDGTILDTLEDIHDCCNHILRVSGYPLRTMDEIRSFVGNGASSLMRHALPKDVEDARFAEIMEAYIPYYIAHANDKAHPYKGIPEALFSLKEAGVKLAVVSNKPDGTIRPLCECHFPGIFDYAKGESPDVKCKPAADLVDAALAFFGIDRCDAVYIGDSEVDVETAKNAGIDGIAVSWGFRSVDRLREAGAKTILHTPEALSGSILKEFL